MSRKKEPKTLPVDIETFKAQVDAVDTKFGGDYQVADLISTLDRMIETLESHGRVYRRRKHQTAGISGYRNVSWHKESQRWTGRVGYTDGNGTRRRKSTGYYKLAEDASAAVEEIRERLGLN